MVIFVNEVDRTDCMTKLDTSNYPSAAKLLKLPILR